MMGTGCSIPRVSGKQVFEPYEVFFLFFSQEPIEKFCEFWGVHFARVTFGTKLSVELGEIFIEVFPETEYIILILISLRRIPDSRQEVFEGSFRAVSNADFVQTNLRLQEKVFITSCHNHSFVFC
jgi:hypothetical protein